MSELASQLAPELSSEEPSQLEKNSSITASISNQASVLTDIYQKDTNMAIWQNKLSDSLSFSAQSLLKNIKDIKVVLTVSPDDVVEQLTNHNQAFADEPQLCLHIATLVDMFCTLFDLKRAGLRLSGLDKAMCPKFHVNFVPCRLVSTFHGPATEWLPNDIIDRSKLGLGSQGLKDEESGLMKSPKDIQQLSTGDVALLKGEGWLVAENTQNEGGGAVHRSPSITNNNPRLLLTLDFAE